MSFDFSLIIIVGGFAASLGLNLSSVAMLSGHALSQQTSLHRLRRLVWGFWLGVVVASLLLLSTIVLFVSKSPLILDTGFRLGTNPIRIVNSQVWRLAVVGLAIQCLAMLFCKILKPELVNPWIPAVVRDYLRQRCTRTTSVVEAISLGLMSVLANTWLLLLPLIIIAINLLDQFQLQLSQIGWFALINSLPVAIIAFAVTKQFKISQIQLFLIKQAFFLQFVSFFSLIILGAIIICFKPTGGF